MQEITKLAAKQPKKPPQKKPNQLTKFLKPALMVGGGTGIGLGAGMLLEKGFEKGLGERWKTLGTPMKRRLGIAALGLLTGTAFAAREWQSKERAKQ